MQIMKSIAFWYMTPCSFLKFNRRFGGTYRLHLLCRRIRRARYQRQSRWQAQKIALFITTAVRTSNPRYRTSFHRLKALFSQRISSSSTTNCGGAGIAVPGMKKSQISSSESEKYVDAFGLDQINSWPTHGWNLLLSVTGTKSDSLWYKPFSLSFILSFICFLYIAKKKKIGASFATVLPNVGTAVSCIGNLWEVKVSRLVGPANTTLSTLV
jgi:hypothetical protein